MELTLEDKTFLIHILSQITFNMEGIEQGVRIKDIVNKLKSPEVKKKETT